MRLLDRFLHQSATPGWLAEIDLASPFPAPDALSGCVYYPSCGFDGRPIQYCGGFTHSFVYVDYGYSRDRVFDELHREGAFRGYRIAGCREVARSELVGPCAWEVIQPDKQRDGDPVRYIDHIKPPFALWAILDRLPHFGAEHGPVRLSLLYIGGEAVASYQALFYSHGIAPAMVAIIQPGEGFGYNWTNFFDSRGIFARTVCGSAGGQPGYLLVGGIGRDSDGYREPFWLDYGELLHFWKSDDGYLGLWRRTSSLQEALQNIGG
ncbi:MAG: hypothetical protein FJY67_11640 [Calditrichaeota bacterium]|nr:hypothetical protein [Calditrichota bacterium]